MKALSVKQPYATALAYIEKNIEFRSKPTQHRGDLLICSIKSGGTIWFDFGGEKVAHPLGVMLGIRRLVDCRPMSKEDLSEFGAPSSIDGWWAWVFDDYNDTVEPKPVKGSISFFNVDDETIVPIPEAQNGDCAKSFIDYDYPNKHDKVPKDLATYDF